MRPLILVSLLVLGSLPASTQSQVRTVLGTGEPGMSATQLNNPFGIWRGPDGGIYFTEYGNHVVRRFDERTKAVTTVAGTGQKGYSGDGGPATAAQLNMPHEIQFDSQGNLLIADTFNHAIRRVDVKTKVITTLAGTGQPGFAGDGGLATKAQLFQPHSIAMDRDGRLLICDTGNQRLRRLDLKVGTIETIAGTGEKKPTPDGAPLAGTPLFGPRTIAVGPKGDLYLALREANQLFHVGPGRTRLEWIAGTGEKGYSGDNGPAKEAKLNGPKGLALAGNTLFIADTESQVIRRMNLTDGKIATILGDGKKGGGDSLARPHGLFYDAKTKQLLVGDSENHRILAVAVR